MASYRGTARALALLVAGAALLAGCSVGSSGENSSAANDESGGSTSAQGGNDAPSGDTGYTESDGRSANARTVPLERQIIYRGETTVRVGDVAGAVVRTEGIVRSVDGLVAAEQTESGRAREGAVATLTVRVPPDAFRSTLDRIGDLGRPLSRSQQAEDVTTQVVDVDSRVQSQRRSVARVRTLLGRADTIGEVVQVEAELARREADLESLEAQLAVLEDQTSLASIQVTLLGRTAPAPKDDDDLGFLAGLRAGWTAFVGAALIALTAVGALVPFLVVALVLAVPAWLLLRSRRRLERQPTDQPADIA